MVEITDSLACLYTGRVESRGDDYVVTVPASEIEHGSVSVGETYRIAVLDRSDGEPSAAADDGAASSVPDADADASGPPSDGGDRPTSRGAAGAVQPDPPVSEGEVREVTIETLGDKGDGIAKIERGYVVIVPDAEPGEEPTVEITSVRENVSFANVVEE
ncbi:TRAM domain-containing protein [Halorubrum ezzemoulense]|jgi:predicted RNA-binding protein with TRAM domain|uniref:Deoxyribonuclease n=2 Tax=Halorubrum ezzemoulense TaxID=337243 RepID=A0A256J0Y6_HALEZ|nr:MULTISPECIES: TRAM domain-containing protein [Halorubrum]MDB2224821.1 TRAM domain-containing protein [Halorubrum ezzemoulense]MDB2241780.1 TRAM domain-containing protein [Halorubrum ezzemoulense]MDB2245401.1 TRAM domain-containing protein [Halorubrum ezzemoulense]MDB2250287.1 TRAM domain-containing protein [Halorubrum ezzemoulense]MDB2259898.1 TRAM domain-containing protein [Halorubrum ezzemoulense]